MIEKTSADLILKINGIEFGGWEAVHVHKNMEELAGAFGIATNNFFDTNPAGWNIKLGDSCVAMIGDDIVATGYVEGMPIYYDDENSFIQIVGRDKTADLIDCTFEGSANEWKKQTVKNIIKNICTPFDIVVVVDPSALSSVSKIVSTFKVQEGMSCFEMISELCLDYSILPLSYGDGKLTLTRARTTETLYDSIEVGTNATSGEVFQSNENRFSEYIIKGTGVGSDNKSLKAFISPFGKQADSLIKRERPKVIFSEGITDSGRCKDRAKWEANMRAGHSRSVTYTVNEWAMSNKKVWEINKLARVKDEFLDIDGTMLVYALDFIYNEDDGAVTKISLVDKNTYSLSTTPQNIKLGFD